MKDDLMRAESLLRDEIEWTERGRRGGGEKWNDGYV